MRQQGDPEASAHSANKQVPVWAVILAIWACKLTILAITVYALRSQGRGDAQDQRVEEHQIAGATQRPEAGTQQHGAIHIHVSSGDSAAVITGNRTSISPFASDDVKSLDSLERLAPLTAESIHPRSAVSDNGTDNIISSATPNNRATPSETLDQAIRAWGIREDHVLNKEKKDVIRKMALAHATQLETLDLQHRGTIAFLQDQHAEVVAALREENRALLAHLAYHHRRELEHQTEQIRRALDQKAEQTRAAINHQNGQQGQVLPNQEADLDKTFAGEHKGGFDAEQYEPEEVDSDDLGCSDGESWEEVLFSDSDSE